MQAPAPLALVTNRNASSCQPLDRPFSFQCFASRLRIHAGQEADVEIKVHLRCLELLHMYAARIYSESTADADLAALQRQTVPDTELLGILNSLVVLRNPPAFSALS
eukprot:Skav235558  [mRNA]  locus=scaffold3067:343295:346851:- [translate_table: standard]